MKFLITFILLCCTSICSAETLHGIVSYVYDGDTIMLQADKRHYRIRLASIDAPELDQPYGLEAKKTLSELVYNKPIIAQVIDTDKYGRKVAKVYAENKNASCYLLEQGAAWHYGRYDIYNEEYDRYQHLEYRAKASKIGLWKQEKPIPPWVWRRG